jgi:hypothetical protein
MSVTVFEDPCPQPGRSMQDLIDRMLGKKEKIMIHEESFI